MQWPIMCFNSTATSVLVCGFRTATFPHRKSAHRATDDLSCVFYSTASSVLLMCGLAQPPFPRKNRLTEPQKEVLAKWHMTKKESYKLGTSHGGMLSTTTSATAATTATASSTSYQ